MARRPDAPEGVDEARRRTEAALQAMWEREQGSAPPEQPLHYVVQFDTVPSEFERIKAVISTSRTCNRMFRHYALGKEGKEAGS